LNDTNICFALGLATERLETLASLGNTSLAIITNSGVINMFKEIPASKMSLAKRKPAYGVGINNATYQVTNKHKEVCPHYAKWYEMIKRCYSSNVHKKSPCYEYCSVCEEWLTFSNFKTWMVKQDWQGKDLDKDLLVKNNKVYSSETCVFIPQQINKLLTDRAIGRGMLKLGVTFNKKSRKFYAQCNDGSGKNIHLGSFDDEYVAHEAYKKYKYALIERIAKSQPSKIKEALLSYRIGEY